MDLGLGLRKKNHVSNIRILHRSGGLLYVQTIDRHNFVHILGVNFSQKIFHTALRKTILENAMTQGGQNGLIQICISKQRGNLMNVMNIEHELLFQIKFFI